jgi:hypothetical protein
MNNLYRGPLIYASYQVSIHLAKRFQRFLEIPKYSNTLDSNLHQYFILVRWLNNLHLLKQLMLPSPVQESNPIIGVCQLTCTVDKDRNFHISKALIQRAQTKGAKVCLYI